MTSTEILVISAIAFPAAMIGVMVTICVISVCYPRQSQVAPRQGQAPEVVNGVAQVPNGNEQAQMPEIEVIDGVVVQVPDGVVRLFDGAERFFPLSPFEPPLMNPTDFLVSAILIFFVFSLLIYAFPMYESMKTSENE